MRRQKGYTLVEVLVSTAIFAVVFTVIISAYLGSQRSFITGTTLLDLQGQTRQSLHWLRKDIKWANFVESSKPINSKTYTTSNTELVLKIPSITNLGDIIDNEFDYVAYHLNDSDPSILERVVGPSPHAASARPAVTYILARDVSALNFSSGGASLGSFGTLSGVRNISISLTTAKTVLGSRSLQSTVTTSITMRNIYY